MHRLSDEWSQCLAGMHPVNVWCGREDLPRKPGDGFDDRGIVPQRIAAIDKEAREPLSVGFGDQLFNQPFTVFLNVQQPQQVTYIRMN